LSQGKKQKKTTTTITQGFLARKKRLVLQKHDHVRWCYVQNRTAETNIGL